MEHLTLLDELSVWLNCEYLSDLKFLDCGRRILLKEKISSIPADTHTPADWNDALEYLVGQRSPGGAEQAKAQLIAGLSAL